MERSAIVPHLSWSGPQPEQELDAYLLAMLVRVHSSGLDDSDAIKKDAVLHPSVLTTANLNLVATMYAYYKEKMVATGVNGIEPMLRMIKDSVVDDVEKWMEECPDAIKKAEVELFDYTEVSGKQGFTVFG